jgi:transketolase
MPSWELFEAQDEAYKERILPSSCTRRLAVEAGSPMGWARYANAVVGVDRFGASAPYKVLAEKYGLTVERVLDEAKALL